MNQPMSIDARHLAHASSRAARRRGYLAWTFARYAELEGVTEDDVLELLGCTPEDFYRLSLCTIAEHPSADDLRGLASFARADTPGLAKIVRRVQTLTGLRLVPRQVSSALLMAARERERDQQEPPGDDERPG